MSVTLLIVDPWQYCVCCIIKCNSVQPFYLDRMCQYRLHPVLSSNIGSLMLFLAAEPRSTAGLRGPASLSVPLERSYSPCIRGCGTGGFQEQGQFFFIGFFCSIPTIVFYYYSLSLLPIYRLVLRGWGLRTDRVYITLSQPCTADFL